MRVTSTGQLQHRPLGYHGLHNLSNASTSAGVSLNRQSSMQTNHHQTSQSFFKPKLKSNNILVADYAIEKLPQQQTRQGSVVVADTSSHLFSNARIVSQSSQRESLKLKREKIRHTYGSLLRIQVPRPEIIKNLVLGGGGGQLLNQHSEDHIISLEESTVDRRHKQTSST